MSSPAPLQPSVLHIHTRSPAEFLLHPNGEMSVTAEVAHEAASKS